jgi:hypothetical protein
VLRFESPADYKTCISKLISGTPVNSLSGVGSNTDNPNPKIPKAIFVGGGFTDEEIAYMMEDQAAVKLAWVCGYTLSLRLEGKLQPAKWVTNSPVLGGTQRGSQGRGLAVWRPSDLV